jgi:hypothetical protein
MESSMWYFHTIPWKSAQKDKNACAVNQSGSGNRDYKAFVSQIAK